MDVRKTLETIYLDWYNNYLTIGRYAECNGLTVDQACALINIAREVTKSPHPET